MLNLKERKSGASMDATICGPRCDFSWLVLGDAENGPWGIVGAPNRCHHTLRRDFAEYLHIFRIGCVIQW